MQIAIAHVCMLNVSLGLGESSSAQVGKKPTNVQKLLSLYLGSQGTSSASKIQHQQVEHWTEERLHVWHHAMASDSSIPDVLGVAMPSTAE